MVKKILFLVGEQVITLEVGALAFWIMRKTGYKMYAQPQEKIRGKEINAIFIDDNL